MLTALASENFSDDPKKERLREIIEEWSVQTGKTFKLAAGGESEVFFDMKKTLLDPEGINLAAEVILDLLKDEEFDAIGGLVIGACPIVDAVCLRSYQSRNIRGLYVRKEAKDTGTRHLIEGRVKPGLKVVMVDDVTTTGASVIRAIDEIVKEKCSVLKVITIVDRLEGAEKNLSKKEIPLVPIFTKLDFPHTN